MRVYETKDKMIGMMQKVNIKLPTPTQFDGRHPHFYEWAGEVKAYLSIHSVHNEDIMDDSTKSATAIVVADIQDEVTREDTRRLNATFPVAPQADADKYGEDMDLTMEIRKKKVDTIIGPST
eukprot:2835508-Amphidinium_carterae.1